MKEAGGLSLLEGYRRLLDRWYWIVAGGVLAGLLGLAASFGRPPIYEASALLVIGVDRSRAQVPDDVTLRQAYDRVRGLLLADDTLEEAIALAGRDSNVEDLPESADGLRDHVRLAEQPEGWQLFVFGTDGGAVERIAQAWSEVSVAALAEASYHAIRAAEWQQVLYESSCRLVEDPSGAGLAVWQCLFATPSGDLNDLPASFLAEVEASRGILPGFDYGLLRGAEGTARPVAWTRGGMVLGATLVGIVLGAVAAVAWGRREGEVP